MTVPTSPATAATAIPTRPGQIAATVGPLTLAEEIAQKMYNGEPQKRGDVLTWRAVFAQRMGLFAYPVNVTIVSPTRPQIAVGQTVVFPGAVIGTYNDRLTVAAGTFDVVEDGAGAELGDTPAPKGK